MVTNATSFGRSGLTDWIIQRVTAVVLGVYFMVLVGFFLCYEVDYTTWYGFMASMPMKIFTILAVASVAAHAWIGLWGVTTDYINSPSQTGLRLLVQSSVGIALFVFIVWALLIIWGA